MKKTLLTISLWIASGLALAAPLLREGDIVFLSEKGNFAKAIQLATHSPYNHVGMVFFLKGQPFVFEAVGPVQFTPLDRWVKRSKDGRFAAKRLKNADAIWTKEALGKLEALTRKYKGKPYSWTFDWSDQKMYCSELVWKLVKGSTGLEVGAFQKMRDLDLSNPLVQKELKGHFGKFIPGGLELISPAQIFNSNLLEPVPQSPEVSP